LFYIIVKIIIIKMIIKNKGVKNNFPI